eukprot:6182114-Pleurochrysis_carterae.AAC.5
MSLDPGRFMYRGLRTQDLPVNYDRWILSQLAVLPLRANHSLNFISICDAMHNALLNERLWHWERQKFNTSATSLGYKFGMKQLLSSDAADVVRANNEETAKAVASPLPANEGHRANERGPSSGITHAERVGAAS